VPLPSSVSPHHETTAVAGTVTATRQPPVSTTAALQCPATSSRESKVPVVPVATPAPAAATRFTASTPTPPVGHSTTSLHSDPAMTPVLAPVSTSTGIAPIIPHAAVPVVTVTAGVAASSHPTQPATLPPVAETRHRAAAPSNPDAAAGSGEEEEDYVVIV